MLKSVRVALKPVIYLDLMVDENELELVRLGNDIDENIISNVEYLVTQSDGTVHMNRIDDWIIEECKIIDENGNEID